MKMSRNFSYEEITATLQPYPNDPSIIVRERYRWMCVFIMEPIREHFGLPVYITSAYRCPRVNSAIGGDPNSYHMATDENERAAIDFQIRGVKLAEVFNWIAFVSPLQFDKVILERGKDNNSEKDDCIHIQIRPEPRRIAMLGPTHGQGEYVVVTAPILG